MKAQMKRKGKGQEGSLAARDALALAPYRAGRTGESLAELRRAIDLHPASPVPRISLAYILLHEGRLEEARADVQGIFALGTRANAHQDRGLDDAIFLHRRIQVRLAERQQPAASRAIEDLRRSAEAFSGYPVHIVSEGLREEASCRFTAAKHENRHTSIQPRRQERSNPTYETRLAQQINGPGRLSQPSPAG